MMVLVDTAVWSLALRRRGRHFSAAEQSLTDRLAELIREGRVQMLGPIRQELLSGIREAEQFRRVRDRLRGFDEPGLAAEDYEEAAALSNQCRARGISGSPTEFLICAVARRRGWQIFTTGQDFLHFGKVVALSLYS